MRGCIRERPKGSGKWQLLFHVDGKQRSITISGTKRDAERRMTKIQREIDEGTYFQPDKTTVSEYLRKWLDINKTTVSETSDHRYRHIAEKHLIPNIGSIQLDALKMADVEDLCAKWVRDGLSPATIRLHHAILHKAFDAAAKLDLVRKNPAHDVRLPSRRWEPREVLDDDELKKLLEDARGTYLYPVVALAVTSGMRVGEICGLKWSDIDFENKRIVVQWTAAKLPGKVVLKEPKTKKGRRVIDIPQMTIDAINMMPRFAELVFARKNGMPTDPSTVSRAIKLRFGVSVHDLRHAHASWLMRQGADPRATSDRMGHSNVGFTMQVYQHITPSQRQAFADKINDLFPASDKQ